jgi:putative endonuclease
MKKDAFYVYMLASQRYGTLYIGVTSDLMKRMWEHRSGAIKGFTQKYKVHNLVWYERHETAESAIKRERNMKEWKRLWKIELIEKSNPTWADLYPNLARKAN